MASGGTGSAGTGDVRVDRPSEGLPGLATTKTPGSAWPENQSANPPTRAVQDTQLATGISREKIVGNIDTTQTSGLTPDQDIKRGQPAAW